MKSKNILRQDKSAASNKLFVVLGMHRSGTSTITRALKVFNISLGDHFIPPEENVNPKGFWEDKEVNALNIEMMKSLNSSWDSHTLFEVDDINILKQNGYFERAVKIIKSKFENSTTFGIKDPRISKLLVFWKEVFDYIKVDQYYILAIRNPLSVAASLAKRDNLSKNNSYFLWLGHVLECLHYAHRERIIVIDYDKFLQNPKNELVRIANNFNLNIIEADLNEYINEYLDISLCHASYDASEVLRDKLVPSIVGEVYLATLDVASDKSNINDLVFKNKIIAWYKELNRIAPVLAQVNNLLQDANKEIELIAAINNITICKLLNEVASSESLILKNELNSEGYLNRYQDIAKAGIDSYKHWLTSGYKEGRLPTSDPVDLANKLVLEREQILQKAIEVKSLRLKDAQEETHELRRTLEAEIVRIKLKTRDEIDAHLLAQIERERSFADQLIKLKQTSYQDRMVEQESTRQQLAELVELNGRREEALQQQIINKERELRDAKEETLELKHTLEAEIVRIKLKARDEISAHLLALIERERSFADQLLKLQQTSYQDQMVEQESARQQLTKLVELHGKREESLHLKIAEKEKELSSIRIAFSQEIAEKKARYDELYNLLEDARAIHSSEVNLMQLNIIELTKEIEKYKSSWILRMISLKTSFNKKDI